MDSNKKIRMENALWGLFIGDALAMPAHWFYNRENIKKTFNGGVTGYTDPPHPHPESFMVGMTYSPDVKNAQKLRRPYDILHKHERFYNTSYGSLDISINDRESEHGNSVPSLQDRYHYHHGLKAGENTRGAQLVRVLMRSVIKSRRYVPKAFLEDFIAHQTTPGLNRDPYTEVYLRRWFENYSIGLPSHLCAEFQRNIWSIGSHGGVIRPMVASLVANSSYQGLGIALQHQNLTHHSENVASALAILVPLMHKLINGLDPIKTTDLYSSEIRVPKITGEKLYAAYREYNGPGNIPKEEMWKLHTELSDEPFELANLVQKYNEGEIIRKAFGTACYSEHGLPLLFYLVRKNNFGFSDSLLANVNAGGDNVHRGMILGLLVGAASEKISDDLKQGLVESNELDREIRDFVEVSTNGWAI